LIVDGYMDDPDNILSLDPVIRSAQIMAGKGQNYHLDNLDEVLAFIEKNYRLETKIDDYSIYRLWANP